MKEIEPIVLSVLCSVIVSAMITKLMAAYYLKIIDGLIEEVLGEIRKLINKVKDRH